MFYQKKINSKYQLIQNKLDLFVLLLCLAPIIPLILGAAISLQDTFILFFRYLTGMICYFLVRDLCEEKKKIFYIGNILLGISFILCLFGIDNMTTNFFTKLLENLNLVYVINIENRMFSTFGYANAFAICLAISFVLTIGRYLACGKLKVKAIYGSLSFLFLVGIILSYSKATILLLALFLLFVFCFLLKKQEKISSLYFVLTEGILACCYTSIWNTFLFQKQYVEIWMSLVIFLLFAYLFVLLLDRWQEKIQKVQKKTYAIILGSIAVLALILVGVGLHSTKPLVLFNAKETEKEVKYKISHIEPSTSYTFTFDIEAIAKVKKTDAYEIEIIEENQYYDKVNSTKIGFHNFEGKKEITIQTKQDTVEIALFIRSLYPIAQERLTIHSLTINNEPYILKYAYLPTDLIHRLQTVSFENKSVWERGVFYQDAWKVIQNHWLVGLGGNAWNYTFSQIQSYLYGAKEVHNYFLQVWMETGIIGMISLVGVLFIAFKLFFKHREVKEMVWIGIAFFLLVVHSFFDFEMSFLYIEMLFFVLLGMIASFQKQKKEKEEKKWMIILLAIFLSIGGIYSLLYSLNHPSLDRAMFSNKRTYLVSQIEKNKYQEQENEAVEEFLKLKKVEKNSLIFEYLGEMSYSRLSKENLEKIYQEIKQIPLLLDPNYNEEKNEMIIEIVQQLTKENFYQKQFATLLIEENEEVIQKIEDQEKNRMTTKEKEKMLEEQQKRYEICQKVME